jgi:hypothetical protein
MAKITALKAGNWNDPTVWDLARIPIVGDTIDLTGFDLTFNADFPDVAGVLDTDTVNGVAGTYHVPTAAQVQAGVYFGPGSSLMGTYPITISPGLTLQQKIDAILSAVFGGELYYIQHPDPDGSAATVAQTYGVFTIIGGACYENLEGDTGVERPRIQISVYAVNSADLVSIVAAVNVAMAAASLLAQTSDPATTVTALFNYSSSVPVDGFEEETRRYYSHMDFNCGGS